MLPRSYAVTCQLENQKWCSDGQKIYSFTRCGKMSLEEKFINVFSGIFVAHVLRTAKNQALLDTKWQQSSWQFPPGQFEAPG